MARHDGVTCDGCGAAPIVGVRWKCASCADFDLCGTCEAAGRRCPDPTQTHAFVKVNYATSLPSPLVPNGLPPRTAHAGAPDEHEGIRCDGCGANPLRGTRFKCMACQDFDLCFTCEFGGRAGHDASHPFLRMPYPIPIANNFPGPLSASSPPPPPNFPFGTAPRGVFGMTTPVPPSPAAPAVVAPFGLFSKADEKPVPLVEVAAVGTIRDATARIAIRQRYMNVEKVPIEATYKFPLEEGAALVGFSVEAGGRRFEGTVKEKEKAFETYSQAIAGGHGGYLVEEEQPDVFTLSVGNLPPGGHAVVEIVFVSILEQRPDGSAALRLPTALCPKYSPLAAGPEGAPHLNPGVVLPDVPYRLQLSLEVHSAARVAAVTSPTHGPELRVELPPAGAGPARVELKRPVALDGDVVLEFAYGEPSAPRALFERSDKAAAAMVAWFPAWTEEDELERAEFVLVIDRSGSMGGASRGAGPRSDRARPRPPAGSKIEQTKNAAQLLLRSLPVGARFNIVGFGSTFQFLFERSADYSQETLDRASQHVAGIGADLGGTEILEPLRELFENRPPEQAYPRQVFILTDGEVSNTQQVVDLVRRHGDRCRVFAFGIGAGASSHLVKSVARAGGGEAVFISDGERIEGPVLAQLARAMQPVVAGVRVDWGPAAPHVAVTPHVPPPVFKGDRLVSYAVTRPGVDPASVQWPREVTLHVSTSSGDRTFAVPLPAAPAEGAQVQQLAGRSLIRDLESGRSPMHDGRGQLLEGRTQEQLDAEVVKTALAYGLASRLTSFVAVERREGGAAEAPMESRCVPVAEIRRHVAPQAPPMPMMMCGMAFGAPIALSSAPVMACASAPPPVFRAAAGPRALRGAPAPAPAMAMAFGAAPAAPGGGGGVGAATGGRGGKGGFLGALGGLFGAEKAKKKSAREAADVMELECDEAGADAFANAAPMPPPPPPAPMPPCPMPAAAPVPAPGFSAAGPLQASRAARPLDRLVLLQAVDGSWGLSAALADALGTPLDVLSAACPPALRGGTGAALWATALAVAFLVAKCADAKAEWALLEKKARRWLRGALGPRLPLALPGAAPAAEAAAACDALVLAAAAAL
eukprot:tig00020572_g11577.t2